MTAIILTIIVLVMILILSRVSKCTFNDNDADQFWYDNYAVLECPHQGSKSLVSVDSSCGCETIHTVCDDCGKTLKVEIEC